MKEMSVCATLTYDYIIEVPDDYDPETAVLEAEGQDPLWDSIYRAIAQNGNVYAYWCQTTSIVDNETGEVIWTA